MALIFATGLLLTGLIFYLTEKLNQLEIYGFILLVGMTSNNPKNIDNLVDKGVDNLMKLDYLYPRRNY